MKIIPFDKEMRKRYREFDKMSIEEIEDVVLKSIVQEIYELTEMEKTGSWKGIVNNIDYSDSTFEKFLDYNMPLNCESLEDFRWRQRAIFEHLDEVKRAGRTGLDTVIDRLKKEEAEWIPKE